MKYDLIVIGSGSVGTAAGYYATRAGLDVLMTDTHIPPHQHGSHHGDTRSIRHTHSEGEKYVPLAPHVQTLWGRLLRHNEKGPIFVRSGVINLSPADSTLLVNAAHSTERWRLDVGKLDAQGITTRWSEIYVPGSYIGLFETDSGLLHGELAIRTWIQLAKEAGCAQLFNYPVIAIRHDDDGVTIETAGGEYQAKRAIVCVGIRVKDLLPELSVQPVRKVFAWYQAGDRYSMKNKFPTSTGELPDGDRYYGFPAENDALKIGKHNGGQATCSADERVPFAEAVSDGSEAFPFLRSVLPGIDCCLYDAACTYDNSPDEDFIIDTLPDHDSTLPITDLSGHGLRSASILGEVVAGFVQDRKSDSDLTPFKSSRLQ